MDLRSLFDHLVDLTEPICHCIDTQKASMPLFDTSGIEAWVTESNPKYANRIIKQLKAFKKAKGMDDSFDPYKAIPSHAAANLNMIKQPVKAISSATVKIPVLNPPAAGCFTFIPRKTCAPIPVHSVVQPNGIPLIRSG